MANNITPKLKAFVRIDGTGRVIPGAPIFQASKPKVGNWREVPLYYRGDSTSTSTTTSTTTAVPTTTTTTTGTPTTTTTTTSGPTLYTVEFSDGDVCTSVSGTRTLEGDASNFCDCTVFTNTTASMNTIKFGTSVLTVVPRNPVDPNIADVVGSCTTC